MTLDERKTLTKISTCNRSQQFPQTSARFGQVENRQEAIYAKELASCIIGGESRGIRISSRNNERIKTITRELQDWFRIKLYIIFVPNLLHFYLYGFRNVISTKHYFQHEYEIQNIIFNSRKLLQISVTKFKIIDVILMCLEILLYKHQAVIKVPGIVKQTVNRK